MNDRELIQQILNSSKDYYSVLQVDKDASLSTIRRSYYKLSLRLHPDKNLDKSEEVKQAFQIVSRSYEVLKDSKKRSIYNRFGEKRLQNIESAWDDIPGTHEFVSTIAKIILFKLLTHAAWRIGAGSFLKYIKIFYNSKGEQNEAFIRYTKEWVDFRRHVMNCFIGVIAFFLILLSFGPICAWLYDANSSKCPTGSAETKDSVLFLPPPRGFGRDHNRAKMLPVYAICLLEADSPSFLACHERLSLLGGLANHTERQPERWFVEQYAGSEEAARAAFYISLTEECKREELLRWASRERFVQTATVRRKVLPLSVRSLNRLPRRKYPEKRWNSKFRESFSVTKQEELFSPLPFCEQLWKQKPLAGAV